MTAAQFPVDGFFEAFVSLPDMGKAFGNRVKVHCFIQIFKLRIDAADQFAVFFGVGVFDFSNLVPVCFSKSLIIMPRLEAFMLFSSAARLMDLQRIIS